MMRIEPCELCGSTTTATSIQMIEWARPVGSLRFANVLRCDDRDGCRARVAAKREPWPIVDGVLR